MSDDRLGRTDHLDRVLADFAGLADGTGDRELEAITAALLLEDEFGVRLSDIDIDALCPIDPPTIRAILGRAQSQR